MQEPPTLRPAACETAPQAPGRPAVVRRCLAHAARQGEPLGARADALGGALTRAAGTRGRPLLQRVYLDAASPLDAWQAATAQASSLLRPWRTATQRAAQAAATDAIPRFAAATTPKLARDALTDLERAIGLWNATWAPGGSWTEPFAALAIDVKVARGDLALGEEIDELMGDDDGWKQDRERVKRLGELAKALARTSKNPTIKALYQDKSISIYETIGFHRGKDPLQSAEFGDARGMRDDFVRIRELLHDPRRFMSLLEPLEQDLADDPTLKLTTALERYERMCGFPTVHAIPIGILPLGDFLDLISRGVHFKDVGAGPVHGSLSHRLQWHAIMRMITANFAVPFDEDAGFTHTPLELYTALGGKPFDSGAVTGRPLWGLLFDESDTPAGTYSAPMSLNADLMNKPQFRYADERAYDAIKAGRWNEIEEFATPHATLPNIWAQLVRRSAKQLRDYPDDLRGTTTPPTAEMLAAYEKRKTSPAAKRRYEVVRSETTESGTLWSILVRPEERKQFEALSDRHDDRVAAANTQS